MRVLGFGHFLQIGPEGQHVANPRGDPAKRNRAHMGFKRWLNKLTLNSQCLSKERFSSALIAYKDGDVGRLLCTWTASKTARAIWAPPECRKAINWPGFFVQSPSGPRKSGIPESVPSHGHISTQCCQHSCASTRTHTDKHVKNQSCHIEAEPCSIASSLPSGHLLQESC